jgi:hypothetical protein
MTYSLFGRSTVVLPVTSCLANPLQPGTSLEDVEMVAKIYHPEDTRRSEVDILKFAYSIAGRAEDEEDRGYLRGHLPLLIASYSWPASYTRRIEEVLKPTMTKSSRKISRCLRILVFLKLRPIHELPHEQFVKAFFDCILCKYHFLVLAGLTLTVYCRSLGAEEEPFAASGYQQEQSNVLCHVQRASHGGAQ